jgi:PAS domain-containing protein
MRVWAHVVITALSCGDGALRGFGQVIRDLTQHRTLEDQLLRAEQRFHQLVDAVADYSIFMLDATGHIATWTFIGKPINPAALVASVVNLSKFTRQ